MGIPSPAVALIKQSFLIIAKQSVCDIANLEIQHFAPSSLYLYFANGLQKDFLFLSLEEKELCAFCFIRLFFLKKDKYMRLLNIELQELTFKCSQIAAQIHPFFQILEDSENIEVRIFFLCFLE